MISIERLLNDEFVNADSSNVKDALDKLEIHDFLKDTINLLNIHLERLKSSGKRFDYLKISHLSSSLLIFINEKIRSLELNCEPEYKIKLEYTISNIIKRLIQNILAILSNRHRDIFITNLKLELEEICILHKYNYDELSTFLKIDELYFEFVYINKNLSKNSDSKLVLYKDFEFMPSFCCNNLNENMLDDFVSVVVKLGITNDELSFKKLFSITKENLAIKLNENKHTYILQFFAWLKSSKFFKSRTNIGFYQVLEVHILNFNTQYLRNKSAQRRIEQVKKLKSWHSNQIIFEREFKKFVHL